MSAVEPVTYLYRCFDRDGQLLYVGVTDNVERRKREHAKDKFWWHDVARVTRMAFQRRTEALWAEWAVISTCAPVYNCSATIPLVPGDRSATPALRVVDGTATSADATVEALADTLTEKHGSEYVGTPTALKTLRAVYVTCSRDRAVEAKNIHNARREATG
jgi:predicted GIY-YIG superfamily endonuclease